MIFFLNAVNSEQIIHSRRDSQLFALCTFILALLEIMISEQRTKLGCFWVRFHPKATFVHFS